MNDEELIERLLLLNEVDCNVAADRIKQLVAKYDEAVECNEEFFVYNQILKERVAQLEGALSLVLAWHDKDKYASGKMTFERSGAFGKARAALAKIKEQQA